MIVFMNKAHEVSLYFDLGTCFDNELDFSYSTIVNTETGEVFEYDEDGALDSQKVVAVFEFEDEDE